MKPVAILHDPVFQMHDLGPGHPECPQRLQAVLGALDDLHLDERFIWENPMETSPETSQEVDQFIGERVSNSLREMPHLSDIETSIKTLTSKLKDLENKIHEYENRA